MSKKTSAKKRRMAILTQNSAFMSTIDPNIGFSVKTAIL
jgi:hypothetical protein